MTPALAGLTKVFVSSLAKLARKLDDGYSLLFA